MPCGPMGTAWAVLSPEGQKNGIRAFALVVTGGHIADSGDGDAHVGWLAGNGDAPLAAAGGVSPRRMTSREFWSGALY